MLSGLPRIVLASQQHAASYSLVVSTIGTVVYFFTFFLNRAFLNDNK